MSVHGTRFLAAVLVALQVAVTYMSHSCHGFGGCGVCEKTLPLELVLGDNDCGAGCGCDGGCCCGGCGCGCGGCGCGGCGCGGCGCGGCGCGGCESGGCGNLAIKLLLNDGGCGGGYGCGGCCGCCGGCCGGCGGCEGCCCC